ncbi:MAG: hypothetical protein KDC95_19065 [Planctomycetes bacterium]|nr:hypothetical protein [Planctomycetota bacterium]
MPSDPVLTCVAPMARTSSSRRCVGLTSAPGLRVHETKTWCEVLRVHTQAKLNRLCVSSDGTTVVYGDYSGLVHVIDVGPFDARPR